MFVKVIKELQAWMIDEIGKNPGSPRSQGLRDTYIHLEFLIATNAAEAMSAPREELAKVISLARDSRKNRPKTGGPHDKN